MIVNNKLFVEMLEEVHQGFKGGMNAHKCVSLTSPRHHTFFIRILKSKY